MRTDTSARTSILVGAVAVVTLLLRVGVVQSADPHPYHEGNYGTAGLPHTDLSGSTNAWDYTNLNRWPQLCRTGSRQSPISFNNVDPSEVVKDAPLTRLTFSPKCFFPREETQMRIVNEGVVNMVSFERQGRLPEDRSECTVVDPLNKTRVYYFSELHFHATSEHKFRNLRPDVEMHISFSTDEVKAKKREVLMVAVMLKASTSINTTSVRALRHILVDGSLPRRHAMTTCVLTEDLSITSLLPARESYLLYDGSETHPPCKENVRWVVMTSPILISRVAVGKLRDAMDVLLPNDFHRFGNARPPQALNGRRIYRFDDTSVPQGRRRSEGYLNDAWTRRNTQNSTGAPNETVGDDVFRLAEESTFASADAAALPLYGDDVRTVLPRTAQGSSASVSASTAEETFSPSPSAEVTEEVHRDEANASASSNAANVSSSEATTSEAHNSTATAATEEPTQASDSLPPQSESDAVPSADEPTPNTNTTVDGGNTAPAAASNSTNTTKKPATKKSKKAQESLSKNTSDMASDSVDLDDIEKSINATASSAWSRLKTFSVRAVRITSAYIGRHPWRAALIVLCNVALFFLICTCIRGWKSPVYVVGIDPRELQPLNPNPAFGQYGGTGAAAVRPVK